MKDSHDSPTSGEVGFSNLTIMQEDIFLERKAKRYSTVCGRMRQIPQEQKQKLFKPKVTSPPPHSQPKLGRDSNGLHRWLPLRKGKRKIL